MKRPSPPRAARPGRVTSSGAIRPIQGRGSLVVAGVGISLARHATLETIESIQRAEKVFHLLTNRAAELWIQQLNPHAVPLGDCFREGKPRQQSYAEMAERIVTAVRSGLRVCAAFYGHPGVLVQPAYDAVARARAEGFDARMLPGISAEDCLFADLSVNPQGLGWQCFEATDFLLRRRRSDPTAALILWQVGMLGEASVKVKMVASAKRLRTLASRLRRDYPPRHPIVLYEAAALPICDSIIRRVSVSTLAAEMIAPATTLYIPPLPPRTPDPRIRRWFNQ